MEVCAQLGLACSRQSKYMCSLMSWTGGGGTRQARSMMMQSLSSHPKPPCLPSTHARINAVCHTRFVYNGFKKHCIQEQVKLEPMESRFCFNDLALHGASRDSLLASSHAPVLGNPRSSINCAIERGKCQSQSRLPQARYIVDWPSDFLLGN